MTGDLPRGAQTHGFLLGTSGLPRLARARYRRCLRGSFEAEKKKVELTSQGNLNMHKNKIRMSVFKLTTDVGL